MMHSRSHTTPSPAKLRQPPAQDAGVPGSEHVTTRHRKLCIPQKLRGLARSFPKAVEVAGQERVWEEAGCNVGSVALSHNAAPNLCTARQKGFMVCRQAEVEARPPGAGLHLRWFLDVEPEVPPRQRDAIPSSVADDCRTGVNVAALDSLAHTFAVPPNQAGADGGATAATLSDAQQSRTEASLECGASAASMVSGLSSGCVTGREAHDAIHRCTPMVVGAHRDGHGMLDLLVAKLRPQLSSLSTLQLLELPDMLLRLGRALDGAEWEELWAHLCVRAKQPQALSPKHSVHLLHSMSRAPGPAVEAAWVARTLGALVARGAHSCTNPQLLDMARALFALVLGQAAPQLVREVVSEPLLRVMGQRCAGMTAGDRAELDALLLLLLRLGPANRLVEVGDNPRMAWSGAGGSMGTSTSTSSGSSSCSHDHRQAYDNLVVGDLLLQAMADAARGRTSLMRASLQAAQHVAQLRASMPGQLLFRSVHSASAFLRYMRTEDAHAAGLSAHASRILACWHEQLCHEQPHGVDAAMGCNGVSSSGSSNSNSSSSSNSTSTSRNITYVPVPPLERWNPALLVELVRGLAGAGCSPPQAWLGTLLSATQPLLPLCCLGQLVSLAEGVGQMGRGDACGRWMDALMEQARQLCCDGSAADGGGGGAGAAGHALALLRLAPDLTWRVRHRVVEALLARAAPTPTAVDISSADRLVRALAALQHRPSWVWWRGMVRRLSTQEAVAAAGTACTSEGLGGLVGAVVALAPLTRRRSRAHPGGAPSDSATASAVHAHLEPFLEVHIRALPDLRAMCAVLPALSGLRCVGRRVWQAPLEERVMAVCAKALPADVCRLLWVLREAKLQLSGAVTHRLLGHVQPHLRSLDAEQLSGVIGAALALDLPPHWWQALLDATQLHMDTCAGQGLADLGAVAVRCSAFARAPPAWLGAYMTQVVRCLDSLGPAHLCRIVASLVRLGARPPLPWMVLVYGRLLGQLGSLSTRRLATVLWAAGAVRYHPGGVFMEHFECAVARHIDRADAQSLCTILVSLAHLRHHSRLQADIAAVMGEGKVAELDSRGLANAAWAIGKLHSLHPQLHHSQNLTDDIFRHLEGQLGSGDNLNLKDVVQACVASLLLGRLPSSALLSSLSKRMAGGGGANVAPLDGQSSADLCSLLWVLQRVEVAGKRGMLAPVCARLHEGLRSATPRVITTALVGLARLRYLPEPDWMATLLLTCHRRVSHFTSPQLAAIVWSLAVLGFAPSPVWLDSMLRELWRRPMRHAGQHSTPQGQRLLAPKDLALTLWSMAKFGHVPSRECLEGLVGSNAAWQAAAAAAGPHSTGACLTAQDIAMILWGLGKLGLRWEQQPAGIRAWVSDLTGAATLQRVSDSFTPAGITLALGGLAALRHPPLKRGAPATATLLKASHARLLFMTPHSLSYLLWAAARLRLPLSRPWLGAWLAACKQRRLGAFSDAALSISMWALARLRYSPSRATWWDPLFKVVHPRLPGFTAHNLMLLVWAMVRLRVRVPGAFLADLRLELELRDSTLRTDWRHTLTWGVGELQQTIVHAA